MSNDELQSKIDAAVAKAIAAQSTAASSAGAAGARTQSNKEVDAGTATDVGQIYKNIDSDIGVNEAWAANVKNTYDIHQTHMLESMGRNRVHFDVLMATQNTHLANLNAQSLQAQVNGQSNYNVANGGLTDRFWNLNETDAYATIAATVTAAVLAELGKNE